MRRCMQVIRSQRSMKPHTALRLVVLLFFTVALRGWPASLDLDLTILPGLNQARITVAGETGWYTRVEVSSDLRHWRPLRVVRLAGVPVILIEDLPGSATHFFRARQVLPQTEVTGASDFHGGAGSSVEIYGQFFSASLGDNQVRTGGQVARVLAASETSLRVELPPNAASGPIEVTTPQGQSQSRSAFVVTRRAEVMLELPVGVDPEAFEIASAYGSAAKEADGKRRLEIRADRPQVIFALPNDVQRPAFLAAVSLGAETTVTFNAASTAEALVFLHPLWLTHDPDSAAQVLASARTNSQVAALAFRWSVLLPGQGDPLDDPELFLAYSNAVVSVAQSLPHRVLSPTARRGARESALSGANWEMDLENILLTTEHPVDANLLKIGVDAQNFTPVDYLALAFQVDARAAFPRGREDFRRTATLPYSTLGVPPNEDKGFPRVGPFLGMKRVEAKQFFRYFDVIAALGEKLGETFGSGGKLETFELPADTKGVYLLRAVGPSLGRKGNDTDTREKAFVLANRENLKDVYYRAQVLNVAAALFDLLSIAIDTSEQTGLLEDPDFVGALLSAAREATESLSTAQSAEEVLVPLYKLYEDVMKAVEEAEAGSPDVKGQLAKAFAKKFRQKGVKILRFVKKAAKILEFFRYIGVVGGVLERADGFLSTSPLESAFIVVGDPFQLDVVSVTPPEGGANDTLEVVIRGATFNPSDDRDRVTVLEGEGSSGFSSDATITSASPDVDGQQKLRIVLPVTLRNLADGPMRLRVRAEGRDGIVTFTHKNKPVIDSMLPADGFAAVADYLGASFPGTAVRVRGTGFGPTNQFFFGGTEASDRSGVDGDVVVNVPKGAFSGTVRVRREAAPGDVREGRGPAFNVIGPPAIVSLAQVSGPIGTTFSIKAENLASAGPQGVVFSGDLRAASERYGDSLRVQVPATLSTGLTEIILVTPAGRAARPFTIEPGRATGATISVGTTAGCFGPTNTPVSLAAALEIASGKRLPIDDTDVNRELINDQIVGTEVDLDCQWEEGDFVNPDIGAYLEPNSLTQRDWKFRWPVGADVADRIEVNGSVTGDFVMLGSYDQLYLSFDDTLTGSLVISGSNNVVNLTTMRGTRLVITGSHNQFSATTCELTEGVLILGDNNHFRAKVQKSKGAGLVLKGSYNEVTIGTESNAGDGVMIDGGRFNSVNLSAVKNGGNGVTLTGGAEGNTVSVLTGIPFDTGTMPGSGNGGHGIALLAGSRFNHIMGTGPIGGNTLDGVHLAGDGVDGNVLAILDAVGNGGDGFHLDGTRGTQMPFIAARDNAGDGVSLSGCREITAGQIGSFQNHGHGIRISGVHDDGSSFASVHTRANLQPGLTLINVQGLELSGINELGFVGLELAGEGVVSNKLHFEISGCSSDGVSLAGARANNLWLDVRNCSGNGVTLTAANANRLEVHSESNRLDGLVLAGASAGNFVSGQFLLNRHGVALTDGAHNNVVEGARSNTNRQHGFFVSGDNTRANVLQHSSAGLPIDTEPPGNGGDGIHLSDGASDTLIGTGQLVSNNAGAGIRIRGASTKGNFILGTLLSGSPVGILLEDSAAETTIGGELPGFDNAVSTCGEGIVIRSGATRTTLLNTTVHHCAHRGILIENAVDSVMGGASGLGATPGLVLLNFGCTVQQNETGLEILGAGARGNLAVGNLFTENETGVRLTDSSKNQLRNNVFRDQTVAGLVLDGASQNNIVGNRIENNGTIGAEIRGGANRNRLEANTITGHNVGVRVTGAGTVGNRLTVNRIFCNMGPGIDLAAGGNAARVAPKITSYSTHSVIGTTDAPDDSSVEVFRDDCGNADEGRVSIGTGRVSNGYFKAELRDTLAVAQVGTTFRLNATVTDPTDNTSEFSTSTDGANGGFSSDVAFESTRDGNAEIYLSHGFDTPPQRLTTDLALDYSPVLSPDAMRVALVSDRNGNADLYVLELRGTNTLTQVTTNAAPDYDPAWTPDGAGLVFASETDGNVEIYRLNLFSGLLTRLTTNSATDRHPAVSPDGLKIAFASNRGGDFDIYVMNADGSGTTRLVDGSGDDTHPVWAPDSRRLAFVSRRDGNAEIYTVKADGSDLIRVTNHPATDTEPAWMAGGDALIFSSNRDAGFELYSVKSDGGDVERLTVTDGDSHHPSPPAP